MAEIKKRVPTRKEPKDDVPIAETQASKTLVKQTRAGQRKRIRVQVPTRMYMFMTGELTIEDLDDDEIRRGQLKNVNGHFTQEPAWIPRELAGALRAEQYRRFQVEMAGMLPDAMQAIHEMVKSRHLMPGDATRLKAAETILERVYGKVTQSVESHVTVDKGKSFDDVIEASLVDVDDDNVEDAEYDELDGVVE